MTTTRRNLGPLTTTWSPRPDCSLLIAECDECDGAKRAQFCGQDAQRTDNGDCWPPRATTSGVPSSSFPFNGWGFYSPGLACPTGYAPACAQTAGTGGGDGWEFQFALVEGETAVGCCPSGYTCASNSAAQTCESIASSSDVVLTGTCNLNLGNIVFSPKTMPFVATATASGQQAAVTTMTAYTLQAPLFQLVYRSSDSASFPAITASPSATSSDGMVADGGVPTSTMTPSGPGLGSGSAQDTASTGLSSGAIAGISVGAVAAVAIIVALVFLLFRARRKAASTPTGTLPVEKGHDIPGHGESGKNSVVTGGGELAGSGEHAYAELGRYGSGTAPAVNEGQPAELGWEPQPERAGWGR